MQVKTKNLVVGALVVFLVGALWYRVVYSPMESKASKANSAAHDADITSANLRKALDGTAATNKTKAKDASTAALSAALPTDSAEAAFLRSIDALRISSGADWASVTPTAPTVAGTLTTINVAISVQGTEAEIYRYAEGLAAMKRLFVLDNLAISAGGSTAAGGASQTLTGHPGAVFIGDQFSAQISGRIFSQPAASAVATAGSTATGTSGSATTPAAGAPAPSGQTGIQNN